MQGKSILVSCTLLKHQGSPDTHICIRCAPCTLISGLPCHFSLWAGLGLGLPPTEVPLFHPLSSRFFFPSLSHRIGLLLTNTSCWPHAPLKHLELVLVRGTSMGWEDSVQQPPAPQTAQAGVSRECCTVLMARDPGQYKKAWETHLILLPFGNESASVQTIRYSDTNSNVIF